jgi:hypothetical protein
MRVAEIAGLAPRPPPKEETAIWAGRPRELPKMSGRGLRQHRQHVCMTDAYALTPSKDGWIGSRP